jgi:hypothetical protein
MDPDPAFPSVAFKMPNGIRLENSAIRGKAEKTRTICTLEERRHQLDMTQTFKILKEVDNVNKTTWFTPASEGQVRVTRMAADHPNARQQASRLDIRRQFY